MSEWPNKVWVSKSMMASKEWCDEHMMYVRSDIFNEMRDALTEIDKWLNSPAMLIERGKMIRISSCALRLLGEDK